MSSIRVAASKAIEASNRNSFSGRGGIVQLGRSAGIIGAAVFALTSVTPSVAFSQQTEDGAGPRRPAMARAAMVQRFDVDGDGRLSAAERTVAREQNGLPPRPGFGPRGGPPRSRPDSIRPGMRGRNRPDQAEPVAMRGPAASRERSGPPRPFRLRGASTDALRPALMTPAQAKALRALVQDFENRVWQVEPVKVGVVETAVATVPASTNALDMLIADYEARVWGIVQETSIDAPLRSASTSASEVLDELVARFEEGVWRANMIEAMPEVDVPTPAAVPGSTADALNALIADYEAKVWEATSGASFLVAADSPVAVKVATSTEALLDELVSTYEQQVWATQIQDVVAMDFVKDNS